MEIKFQDVTLRDMRESDIEDYVRWFTKETEWGDWDAPWEALEDDEASARKKWTARYERVKALADDEIRSGFEVEYDGKHIGSVSSYWIDETYTWISGKDIQDGQKVYQTVGISICESGEWGKGIGTKALQAFIQYFQDRGYDEICTQTWSGNARMLRCAEKLGFSVCKRIVGIREVRGGKYDALTLKKVCRQPEKTTNAEQI